MQDPPAANAYFTTDRGLKYGFGVPRLLLVCLAAFSFAPRLCVGGIGSESGLDLLSYLRAGRWVAHAYIGSIGALVNVEIGGLPLNVALLTGAAVLVGRDALLDHCMAAYLVKTFGGDFLAGKLDTLEWKLVLGFTFAVVTPLSLVYDLGGAGSYLRIILALFLVQLVCELGDAHLEDYTFFRHRYSFECLSVAVLALTPRLQAHELRTVQHDLVICLFYRLSNLAIIAWRSVDPMLHARVAFRAFGWATGSRLELVTDVDTALAVMRASACKGNALERLVHSPACCDTSER